MRLEPHKLLNLTNTWDAGVKVAADHGISLVIRAGFYDTGFEAGYYLASLGAALTDSHSTPVYEQEQNGGCLGRLKRNAGWTGAIGIGLVWCIRYPRPDFHWVTVRQRPGIRPSRSRLVAVSGTKCRVCVHFHMDAWVEVP